MKFILFLMILLSPNISVCKPLFIGDSLTYSIAKSYIKTAPADAKYLVGGGLQTKDVDWESYLKNQPLEHYDMVIIILGTNDFIEKNYIDKYEKKATGVIQALRNKTSNIIWVLPPTLKNSHKNALLNNTRLAIQNTANQEKISIIDMQLILGEKYFDRINGILVRTQDGIHLTSDGADLVSAYLIQSLTHKK